MLCQCGCGADAGFAPRIDKKRGVRKGDPLRFRVGHNMRLAIGPRSAAWHGGTVKRPAKYARATIGLVPIRDGSRIGHIVDVESGCWHWTGSVSSKHAYGILSDPLTGKRQGAHRYYYERKHGPIAAGLDLDHTCRRRWCVNPDHLEPVTKHVNNWRSRVAKLTPDGVRDIRRRYARGGVLIRELAAEFGVSSVAIHSAIVGRTWSLVE